MVILWCSPYPYTFYASKIYSNDVENSFGYFMEYVKFDKPIKLLQ